MPTDGTAKTDDQVAAEAAAALKAEQETSTDTKKYSESEVLKIKNDALAKVGRTDKEMTAREEAVKAREESQATLDRAKDEEAYEKARGNPTALEAITKDREAKAAAKTLKDEKDAFEREKVEQQVRLDTAEAVLKVDGIAKLATKFNVDLQTLIDLDLNLENTERIAQKITPLSADELAKLGKKPAPKERPRDKGVVVGSSSNLGEGKPKDILKEIDRQIREKQ